MPRFCELCGNEIPDTLNACPTCGLRIDFDENRPEAAETETPGEASPYEQGNSWQQADNDSFGGLGQEPGSPLDYPYGNEPQTLPPGMLPPPQTGPPGDCGYSPPPPGAGDNFPPPPPGQPVTGAWGTPSGRHIPSTKTGEKKNFPVVLVVILAIGILLLGGSAFAYFMFLKPASTNDAATALVSRYLNAVGSGDAQTIASLHVSGMQPSQETLNAISTLGSVMTLSYGDLKVVEISSGPDEMEVKVTAAKLSVDVGGNKKSITLEDMKKALGDGFTTANIRLKKQGGQWLVNQTELIDPFTMQIDTSTPVIPSASSS